MGLKSAKILAAALLLTCALDVRSDAQSQYIQQSGPVTSGHPGYFVYNGIMADGGPATNGNLSELGITANGGYPFCIQNTKVHTGPYVQLCSGVTGSTGYLSLNGYGGAVPTFSIDIDGTSYPFPLPYTVNVSPVKTANYTVQSTDAIVPVNASAGSFNITIPRAIPQQFTIPKQGNDDNPVYVYDDATPTPNLLFVLIAGGQAICWTYRGTDGNVDANGVQ
jgi:hypothetical protein